MWQQQLANELIVRRFLRWDKAMSYYSPTRMKLKNIAADHAWVGSRSRATGHIPFGTMSYSWFALLIQSDRTLLISGLFVAPSHWWPHLMGTALRGPQSDIVQKREAVKWMAQCIPQTHRTMCGRTRNSCLHCYLECMRIAHMYVCKPNPLSSQSHIKYFTIGDCSKSLRRLRFHEFPRTFYSQKNISI